MEIRNRVTLDINNFYTLPANVNVMSLVYTNPNEGIQIRLKSILFLNILIFV